MTLCRVQTRKRRGHREVFALWFSCPFLFSDFHCMCLSPCLFVGGWMIKIRHCPFPSSVIRDHLNKIDLFPITFFLCLPCGSHKPSDNALQYICTQTTKFIRTAFSSAAHPRQNYSHIRRTEIRTHENYASHAQFGTLASDHTGRFSKKKSNDTCRAYIQKHSNINMNSL
jgi:hypothetical protein